MRPLLIRRTLPPIVLGLVAVLLVLSANNWPQFIADAQQGNMPPPNAGCPNRAHLISQDYPNPPNPLGPLEPEFPIWCYPQPQAGESTAVRTANSWVDSWNNEGPAIQTLNDHDYDYRVFDRFLANPVNFKAGAFINTDHWMIDLVDVSTNRLSGGVLVSPDQTFQFEDGKLVVEVDAAAGAPGMGSADHYYELDISPADEPTPYVVDALYGYGQFGGVGAMGCRLEGGFICAMYDDSGRATDGRCVPDDGQPVPPTRCPSPRHPGRVWETQGIGNSRTAQSVRGGFGRESLLLDGPGRVGDVYRACPDNVHDYHCRDRFRMEITKDSIHLFVNGRLAMAIDGLYAVNPETGADNRIPDSWLAGGVRFYMNSWINGGQHTPRRWHWNHVAVNPPYPSSEAVSDSYCAGNTLNNANGTQSPNTCAHAHVPGLERAGTTPPPTSVPVATNTPIPPPTSTPVPPTSTPTPTSVPDATSTPAPTDTPTPIPDQPTSTPTPVAEATATPECILTASRGGTVFWQTVAPPNACS